MASTKVNQKCLNVLVIKQILWQQGQFSSVWQMNRTLKMGDASLPFQQWKTHVSLAGEKLHTGRAQEWVKHPEHHACCTTQRRKTIKGVCFSSGRP